MVMKKRLSKRRSLHDKYKIIKRVSQHHKKLRREDRAKAQGKKKYAKKDPGIPNLWPFKEEMLKSIEEKKLQMMEKKAMEKQLRKERKQKGQMEEEEDEEEEEEEDDDDDDDDEVDEHDEEEGEEYDEFNEQHEGDRKVQYMRELREVVEMSDVLLQVLDARDPEGCRAPELEKMVLSHPSGNKRLVLVLNKIDLIPGKIAKIWVDRLREEFPTIAFKASTQNQGSHLGQRSGSAISIVSTETETSSALGAEDLVQLLKNYSRNLHLKTAITVGVVGYPNVGKSSLINSLKRTRAVSVSSTPGHTKSLQVVHLDKKVKIIDSPGVLFAGKNATDSMALRNCLDPATLEDPLSTVAALIGKCSPEQLMQVFSVERFTSPEQFLAFVARKRGKLGRGGIPDLSAAARLVLQDWNAGKVPFYSLPKEKKVTTASGKPAIGGGPELVSKWSKEFDIEALLKQSDEKVLVHGKPEDEFIGMEM